MKRIKIAVAIAFSVMLTGVFCSCGSNGSSSSVSGKNNQTTSSTSKAIENSSASNSSASNSSALKEAKESSENNSSALKGASVGDIVKFGSYEQDSSSSNGKEEIEWLVLAKESDRILIISKYALDCQQYNTSLTDVTWETCSLRKWLNGTFISNAFNSDEQKMIQTTTVMADKNPSYSTLPGNNTTDKVFLLSIPEADKYFSSDEARKCAPTDYAKAQGAYTTEDYSVGGKDTCCWLLRTPGDYSDGAAYVNADGSINFIGFGVARSDFGVRPSLWVYYGSETIENKEDKEAIENQEVKEAIDNSSALKGASVGDIVKFGAYEQDNNSSNGKEEIEWIVLAKEGNKALVVSKYVLDCQPYNTSRKNVTWETCSLRKWLNETFISDAFSSDEQNMIPITTVLAEKNPDYRTIFGNDTTDKIFLLNIYDMSRLRYVTKMCAPTEYAKAQGVWANRDGYSVDGKATCSWWLQSPGNDNTNAAYVEANGAVRSFGTNIDRDNVGVRPVLWIDLGS